MTRTFLALSFLFSFFSSGFAQNPPIESAITIRKAVDEIKVDGVLDEQTWQEAQTAKDFYLAFPVDNDFPISQTEVKASFDDDFLYFGAICHDPTEGDYLVESLRRDWSWRETENLSIYIDPFDDRTNGFNFSISPYNSQREGLIINGAEISEDWDNKWYSRVTNFDDKWVVEIAIPFKTLRYKDNVRNWNIQFLRNDVKNNQRSAWTAVPQQYRTNNLAYAGKMNWEDPPPPPKVNISVIPYVSGSVSRDYEEGKDWDPSGKAGFDAKVAVTSSLNLDLTVNPDFSNVEVDQQVVNLQRFELFFPEKRQFFLENSDLFANSGFQPSRPFFSRRIGIAEDTAGNRYEVPIIFGARLSGKLNKDWRIGLMNMQTQERQGVVLPGSDNENDGYNLPGQNYTAAVIERKLWTRSNIRGIFLNRQATNYNSNDTTLSTSQFNRVAGIDFNFASYDDKWSSSIYLHASMDPVAKQNAVAHGAYLGYQTRHWTLRYFHNYVGAGYNAELGFVPRKDIYATGTFESGYIFYPQTEKIVTIRPGIQAIFSRIPNGRLADIEGELNLVIAFQNTSEFKAAVYNTYTYLFDDFDPTRSDKGQPLPADTDYSWYIGELSFKSDTRKAASYEVVTQYGSFYNGTRFSTVANVGYRFRPFGSFFISAVYNDVQLPEPYSSDSFWLIGPRADITFTNSLFLTTFVQYNEQADNVNINARFQWRFAPVSDLFIVYTDNYLPNDFNVKNRALVVKLSYWLNI
jgi:hypothetical protein